MHPENQFVFVVYLASQRLFSLVEPHQFYCTLLAFRQCLPVNAKRSVTRSLGNRPDDGIDTGKYCNRRILSSEARIGFLDRLDKCGFVGLFPAISGPVSSLIR